MGGRLWGVGRSDSQGEFLHPTPYTLLAIPSSKPHVYNPAMQRVTVLIKHRAECRDLPLPSYETEGSVGMDLAAAVDGDVVLGPGERALIPCGFCMALPPGYEVQVRPRSGLAVRYGVSLVNTPGTIDSDYRGEVKVPMINHGAEPFTVKRGMRIAQMIVMPVPPVELVEVDELPETARGEGGFGHTGL